MMVTKFVGMLSTRGLPPDRQLRIGSDSFRPTARLLASDRASFLRYVIASSTGSLQRSPKVTSISLKPRRPAASLESNSGAQSAWKYSIRRSLQPLSIQGKVKPSVENKMSATLSSAESETVGSRVAFQRLEEELLEGCSLQHGEMNTDGFKIHFVEAGDPAGKLVVLLHGWPNFWLVWRYQFQPLVGAGYHVIAPDLRGYNISSKPKTLQGYARSEVLSDIVKLIDNFGANKPAILVGHDWGANISWCFAEDYPSKVERLVTVNMGRLVDFKRVLKSNFQQLRKSWYIGLFQIPVLAEWVLTYDNIRFMRNLKSVAPAITDEDIRRHVAALSNPGAVKGGVSYYRAAFQGLWNNEDENVPVVTIPVTVLWGDQDAYLLPIIAETDTEKAPNHNVVHLSKSGHWPMWDEPILFNKLLQEAISGDGEKA